MVLLGLSLAYIVPLCDVAATSYINFHDGLKGGFSDASYREPGRLHERPSKGLYAHMTLNVGVCLFSAHREYHLGRVGSRATEGCGLPS